MVTSVAIQSLLGALLLTWQPTPWSLAVLGLVLHVQGDPL